MSRQLFQRSPWLAPLAIVAATLLAYWSAYHAGFIWDDDDYVTQNPVLRTWSGLWQLWTDPTSLPQYYPLVHTTFWIEFQLWGLEPAGYHVVNVGLHALNACLVHRILRDLRVPGALFAALLFAVHPVHVESVAWITERKNVLSGAFYLAALKAYLAWRPLEGDAHRPLRFGVAAMALFVCALLSKSVTCSLPAAVLLLVYWKRGRVRAADWKAALPFFAVGLAMALYTASLERVHVKAVGSEFDFSSADRILIAGRAAWFYLGKLLVPFPLSFNYERWSLDPGSIVQWLFPIGVVVALALLFALRRRLGRGPLVAILFFGGTLVPALGFFNTYPMRYSFVADHFQYLASLGPLVLLAAGVTLLRLTDTQRIAAASAVIGCLGSLTFVAGQSYAGHETLWRDTLAKNPSSWIAMNNLAKTLLDRGDSQEATTLLERSLDVRESAEAHLNLGVLRHSEDDIDAALGHFERAIELKPEQAGPRNNKAVVLMQRRQLPDALEWVDSALALDPDFADALGTRAQVLLAMGRHSDAQTSFDRALRLNPQLTQLYAPAAEAALAAGEVNQALLWAANAVRLRSDDAAARQLTAAVVARLKGLSPDAAAEYCASLFRQIGSSADRCAEEIIRTLRDSGDSRQADAVRRRLLQR